MGSFYVGLAKVAIRRPWLIPTMLGAVWAFQGLQGQPVVPETALFAFTVEGLYEMAYGDRLRTKRRGGAVAGSRALPPVGVRHA